jgi:hypothetical protein
LEEVGLHLQPAESALYIPSYRDQENPPAMLASLREEYQELQHIPWKRQGITVLGCPLGTDDFVQASFADICNSITQRAAQYAQVDDGLIHLQLLKFSVNNMLPYFLRTTSPGLTVPYAKNVDALIWKAILDFSDVSEQDRSSEVFRTVFQDARCQVALPIAEGGLGITPNECVATPAFYSAVSRALRFATSMEFGPVKEYLASPDFLNHPLWIAYAAARQDLISWGAQEPPPPGTPEPQQEAQPPPGPNAQPRREPKPITLPTLQDVLSHDGQAPLLFPDQHALTNLAQKAQACWSTRGLSPAGQTRVAHLSKQLLDAYDATDETAVYLHGIANFPKELKLKHSPLAFINHTESLSEPFPRDVFGVYMGYTLGWPAQACLQNRDSTACVEGCDQTKDVHGHHRMCCRKTASYLVAHTRLADAVADLARKSGVPYTDKNVPTHLTTFKVGDALLNLSSDSRKLVVDYTLCHPVVGTRDSAGIWSDRALVHKAREKCNHHRRHYAVLGFAFAPCAATTYGQLHVDLLRLLYIFAMKRAEAMHVNYRPFTPVKYLFGLYFAQGRAKVGAAIARGMALRALGCSMTGVSKVFLRHIAPTRGGDQTLSSGAHLTTGLAHWRLALAA